MKKKKGLKKGLRKALSLAYKMLKWLEENDDRDDSGSWSNNITVRANHVRVRGYLKSFRTVHKFKREFKGLGKFERNSHGDRMDYELELTDIPLMISIEEVKVLPPSCKIVYKDVEVPEQYIEGYVLKAHTKKVGKVVCGPKNEELTPA